MNLDQKLAAMSDRELDRWVDRQQHLLTLVLGFLGLLAGVIVLILVLETLR